MRYASHIWFIVETQLGSDNYFTFIKYFAFMGCSSFLQELLIKFSWNYTYVSTSFEIFLLITTFNDFNEFNHRYYKCSDKFSFDQVINLGPSTDVLLDSRLISKKARGKKPLNTFNQMDQWQTMVYSFLD